MLFNSVAFALFLPASLIFYWMLAGKLRAQNAFLVVLSYIFYGFWDWRFLFLLLVSTLIDFTLSNRLHQATDPRRRKQLLTLSMCANLGILGFFKYFGFFVHSFGELLQTAGINANLSTLSIILPVGISFYTFQTMSYTVDVYRGKLEPTRDPVALAAYVAFFPQLVAGPIERGWHLLPQMLRPRRIGGWEIRQGIWLILLGFFRKCVIADNAAFLVERVYKDPSEVGVANLLVATGAFAIQIYGDFAGYSGIARGVSFLFGFDLMVNFRAPYFSTSIQEFWRRWHISLSSWLRDYLYIPLGGNQGGAKRTYINLMLTMLLGGLWHGAAWNFVLWGGWQGLGLAGHRLFFRRRSLPQFLTMVPRPLVNLGSWILTMLFVLQGWVLFRAHGMGTVVELSSQWLNFGVPSMFSGAQVAFLLIAALLSMGLDSMEARNYEDLVFASWSPPVQLVAGAVMVVVITLLGSFSQQPFLYFQF